MELATCACVLHFIEAYMKQYFTQNSQNLMLPIDDHDFKMAEHFVISFCKTHYCFNLTSMLNECPNLS